ncbi:MAG: GNAT family N-acetyltransferase [Balneolales bacterium]|nr:GNAT family N-acetyltransferase [Balneolales bacterium]
MELETDRLLIRSLHLHDAEFILDLVNSPGWQKFIGDRNLQSVADSKNFIQIILDTPDKEYYTVLLKEGNIPVGVLSFMKREYLEYFDFGFALLPNFGKKGYAFEASAELLKELRKKHKTILATTLNSNINSIRLLEKLGFSFQYQMERDGEKLKLFALG